MLSDWNKHVFIYLTVICHVSGPGWSVSWLPPARCPGAALCFYWSAGKRPRSLGTMSAPCASVCRYAPPCWAQSISQRSHCSCDLHWQLMLCANQTSWAAKAQRVNDWMLKLAAERTGDKFLLSPFVSEPIKAGRVQLRVAEKRVFSSCQHLPAHCLVGELSHSVELLLHLVFFCVTTGR